MVYVHKNVTCKNDYEDKVFRNIDTREKLLSTRSNICVLTQDTQHKEQVILLKYST